MPKYSVSMVKNKEKQRPKGRTDLRLDVPPFSGSLQLNEKVVKLFSHGNDTIGHLLHLSEPA